MHILDNFIRDKFLGDILELFEKYKIEDNNDLLENIWRNVIFKEHSPNFRKDIQKIYINFYQRNFAVLEVLVVKQQLEIERQVFNIVKNYISENNIGLTWTHILNAFISYKNEELIQHPDPIVLFPVYEPAPDPELQARVAALFNIYIDQINNPEDYPEI